MNDNLKMPIRVGSRVLPSRLVMAPMETRKTEACMVSDALCNYYAEKTTGGYLGMVVSEHCFVRQDGKACENQLDVSDDKCISGLTRMAGVIHDNQVSVILQLSHAGCKADPDVTGCPRVSPSGLDLPGKDAGGQEKPVIMTVGDILQLEDCFVRAAVRAKTAGFDGVELHSAHSYLLNEFYSPLTNRRDDMYTGRTLEGRLRMQCEIIEKIRKATGEGFLISVRLGASDYADGGAVGSEAGAASVMLEKAGTDMISVSGGMCDFLRPGHKEQGWFAELSETIKNSVSIPVLLTGGIKDREAADRLIREGKADMIGVGRALLKDSGLPEKWLGG